MGVAGSPGQPVPGGTGDSKSWPVTGCASSSEVTRPIVSLTGLVGSTEWANLLFNQLVDNRAMGILECIQSNG
jgi:hypothetical protein